MAVQPGIDIGLPPTANFHKQKVKAENTGVAPSPDFGEQPVKGLDFGFPPGISTGRTSLMGAELEGIGRVYRMRALDTTLTVPVYWSSLVLDSAGRDYTGPGPLTGVVVSNIIP